MYFAHETAYVDQDITIGAGTRIWLSSRIRVMGAVNAPTSMLCSKGASLDYYIGNPGGFARLADKGG